MSITKYGVRILHDSNKYNNFSSRCKLLRGLELIFHPLSASGMEKEVTVNCPFPFLPFGIPGKGKKVRSVQSANVMQS